MYASQWEAQMFGFWLVAGCKICTCLCLRGFSLTTSVLVHVTHCQFTIVPTGLKSSPFQMTSKIGLVFSEQLWVFSGYFERVSTASQCRKIQNHYHHRYYGFFRRLFGVKNVATWSFLVVEATGDWKVGWVGSHFFCFAYKFSDLCVSLVEDVIQAWVWRMQEEREVVECEVRRVWDNESLKSEKKATNCRPNWSERLSALDLNSVSLFGGCSTRQLLPRMWQIFCSSLSLSPGLVLLTAITWQKWEGSLIEGTLFAHAFFIWTRSSTFFFCFLNVRNSSTWDRNYKIRPYAL